MLLRLGSLAIEPQESACLQLPALGAQTHTASLGLDLDLVGERSASDWPGKHFPG